MPGTEAYTAFFKWAMNANVGTAKTLRCVPFLQELRLTWAYNDFKSAGMQEFVDRFLPDVKRNNPHVNFWLHRTYTRCDPFIEAVYEFNRRRNQRCNFRSGTQILALVEEYGIGGKFVTRKKSRGPYGVKIGPPHCLKLFPHETKGHDVFKVFSKRTAQKS